MYKTTLLSNSSTISHRWNVETVLEIATVSRRGPSEEATNRGGPITVGESWSIRRTLSSTLRRFVLESNDRNVEAVVVVVITAVKERRVDVCAVAIENEIPSAEWT